MSFKDLGTDYGYIYYQNNSKTAILEEKINFPEFEGLELQFPFSGSTVNVTVDPGEEVIAIVKRVANAYKYTSEIFTNIKDGAVDEVQEAKTKGEKFDLAEGVAIYSLYFQDSFVLHYESTNPKQFEGHFEFNLTNLKVRKETFIEDYCEDKFKVALNPGEQSTYHLDIVKPFEACNYAYNYKYLLKNANPKPKKEKRTKKPKKAKRAHH